MSIVEDSLQSIIADQSSKIVSLRQQLAELQRQNEGLKQTIARVLAPSADLADFQVKQQLAEREGQLAAALEALQLIKHRCAGEKIPNWTTHIETGISRGYILDWCDVILSNPAAAGEAWKRRVQTEVWQRAASYIRDWRECDCGHAENPERHKYNTTCGHAIDCDWYLAASLEQKAAAIESGASGPKGDK